MTAAAAAEAPPCWSRAACEETPARPLRIGSLCTGYGGLDMAVLGVFGGELVWVADNEPGAAQIIAHRHPGVKNLGDITLVDWAKVEPVDVLVAGFPCQDLSYAGLGAGIIEGNRSGLWFTLALAIRVLRPRLVVLENVAAIVGRRPGLDVVAASLAALGFDAEWDCVRAADVGAPHIRDRWFALAWPKDGGADAENTDREPWGQRGEPAPGETGGGRAWADAGRPDRAFPDGSSRSAADPAMRGRARRPPQPQRGPVGGTPAGWPSARDSGVQWGKFAPAIERWELLTGRAAPAPTDMGRTGPRLSPRFVEWLMGLPPGWVTDVPGLSRSAQLKALGNGVVPQQAVAAIYLLAARIRETWDLAA